MNLADQQRGMVEGTTTAGGFGVPLQLDPSIILTSGGVQNPIRELARVITVTTNKWRGVSSDGVTASYDDEAEEVSDDTPVLALPAIDVAMGRAFVPFSIEIEQDWQGLAQELTRLIADGQATLDATAMLTGSGTGEPGGVLTGLSATQKLDTAASTAFGIADIWALRKAIPARFKANAAWAANPDTFDLAYQFVGVADATDAVLFAGGSREGALLGKRTAEWSTMDTGTTAGKKLAISGDFREAFTICDRIGMSVEVVPHLFGATRRPTGQRGLFAYWRTGSGVVNPNAVRYLI